MAVSLAFIGFGVAGAAFAVPGARAFDVKPGKQADYERAGVTGCSSAEEALKGADAVFSLVTADQALPVARDGARRLEPNALWFDMNSVAPDTKREAARLVTATGARYVDVAVMSPVLPGRRAVPLLVSGPDAQDAVLALNGFGFSNVRAVGDEVGSASSIKMIRSIMVKGIEALTAECMLAAEAAGVTDEVLASLDSSPPPAEWRKRADYNLDRMLVHGQRRAAEMEEVVRTLEGLAIEPWMTRGTVARQRALGSLGIVDPPDGLANKLAMLRDEEETAE